MLAAKTVLVGQLKRAIGTFITAPVKTIATIIKAIVIPQSLCKGTEILAGFPCALIRASCCQIVHAASTTRCNQQCAMDECMRHFARARVTVLCPRLPRAHFNRVKQRVWRQDDKETFTARSIRHLTRVPICSGFTTHGTGRPVRRRRPRGALALIPPAASSQRANQGRARGIIAMCLWWQ